LAIFLAIAAIKHGLMGVKLSMTFEGNNKTAFKTASTLHMCTGVLTAIDIVASAGFLICMFGSALLSVWGIPFMLLFFVLAIVSFILGFVSSLVMGLSGIAMNKIYTRQMQVRQVIIKPFYNICAIVFSVLMVLPLILLIIAIGAAVIG